jgi:hypothetical protein
MSSKILRRDTYARGHPSGDFVEDLKTRFDSRFCRIKCQMTVSAANCLCGQIRLDQPRSVRPLRGIFCRDISEFASYHLSHAVQSLVGHVWVAELCATAARQRMPILAGENSLAPMLFAYCTETDMAEDALVQASLPDPYPIVARLDHCQKNG